MVKNILEKVDYNNYQVFVGTYPNDPKTQSVVDEVSRKYSNVIKVVTQKPGPTSKSDCLNNIYRAMLQYEKMNNMHFDMVILHDAEDVVHPYEFLLANYFLLTADALQIPILPLPTSSKNIIHWIYADEFALFQMRDSYVREKTGGFVPFAGVGMCLSRRALNHYQKVYHTTPFPEHSLTEDYLLSSRMRNLGLKIIFLKVTLQDEFLDCSKGRKIFSKRKYFISNWAYFPMDFKRSVRQKTRWLTGIVFQGWEELGWKGSLRIKENFFKDRRLILDQLANIGALMILTYFILLSLSTYGILNIPIVNVLDDNLYIKFLFALTLLMMFKDCIEKFFIVSSIYGYWQGFLSIPRSFIANIINAFATIYAFKTYLLMRKGKSVHWDKTMHLEGVGSIPSDTLEKAPISQSCILEEKDLIAFLSMPYEKQLETLNLWNINQLTTKDSLEFFIKEDAKVPWIKEALLALSLTNIKTISPMVDTLLKSNNITVITNCLEYLYETNQLNHYTNIIETQSSKVCQNMFKHLLKNRMSC